MVSDEARERVLNSLVKNLNRHEDVNNAEVVDGIRKKIKIQLNRRSDDFEQQLVDLIENSKEYYLYNKEKYIPKFSPSDYHGRGLEVYVRVIVTKSQE